MHCVMLQWHPMVGLDFHDEITATAPPAPAPNIPHVCGHVLYGWTLGDMSPPAIKANGMRIALRGTDIKNGIPHVPIPPWPPILLLPLVIGFSGSKSHFGPASVTAKGKPIAAAIAVVVNLNLNCNSLAPLPTGIVVAPSTVVCGMTLGDILGGFFAMGADALFGFVLNKITGGIGKWVAGDAIGKVAAKVLGDTVSAVLQTLFGSPLGWSPEGAPVGDLGGKFSDLARGAGEWIGDKISPPPKYGPSPSGTGTSAPGATPGTGSSGTGTSGPKTGGSTPGTGTSGTGTSGPKTGSAAPPKGGASPSAQALEQPFRAPPLAPGNPTYGLFEDPSVEEFG